MPAHLTIARMAVISLLFRVGGSGPGLLAGLFVILTTELLMYRLKVSIVRVLLERRARGVLDVVRHTGILKKLTLLLLQFSNYENIIPDAAPAVKP